MKDVLVVGYGPAGVTAAIYAARKKLSVTLIGDLPGGEVRNSGEIANWPGDGVTDGNTLAEKFISHLELHQSEVTVLPQKVSSITKQNDLFTAVDEQGTEHHSRTIIYTAGRHPRKLNVPGEEEFKNRGVSYCATCDGPLFPDKRVAIIGGGNTGAEAVIMLQNIASHISLLHIEKSLPADPILVQNFENDPKVDIIYEAKTSSISGDAMVQKLTYVDTEGAEQTLEVDGVFITVGAIPNTEPVKDLVSLDKFGAIEADRYGHTNTDGFFAAGDVTNIRDAQIVVAAGQGCSAALSAGDYLSRVT